MVDPSKPILYTCKKVSYFDTIEQAMNSELAQILRRRRQVIYTITDLQALMSGTSDGRKAVIKRAIADGTLIHIKRGLYYANPEITHKKPHGFDVAQLIDGPSFISLESALS